MHELPSCEVCFRVNRTVECKPRRYLYKEQVWACGYRKRKGQSVHVSIFLEVSHSSKESAVQQE